jgi:hypothetical protein
MRHYFIAVMLLLGLGAPQLTAEIPTVLTDKIRDGIGVIDLLKDASSAELSTYLSSGVMFLGVDVNEHAAGLESQSSAGIAIKQIELVLTTVDGDVSFTDFYTNTTAMIQEAGASEAQEFYTLFGTTGSSELNGNSDFDISSYDDVIEVRDISVEGEILGATLNVTFVETSGTGANEEFFDFSNGFEEMAILASEDASVIDGAELGLSENDLPATISYSTSTTPMAHTNVPEPSLILALLVGLMAFITGGTNQLYTA